MPLTAAQLCTLAQQDARCPGFSVQAAHGVIQGRAARAPGPDQGAVDIEKQD